MWKDSKLESLWLLANSALGFDGKKGGETFYAKGI
jgi:hypothetical protein